MGRTLFLVACFLVFCTSAQGGSKRVLQQPNRADIAGGPIVDSVLRAHAVPAGFWGGTYTTPSNEHVTIYSSPSYAVNDATNQKWANFLASLVHGSELANVKVYLAPPPEVSDLCGSSDVVGCWEHDEILAPGEDSFVPAESVLTHEYGHEIAAHRTNAPWRALDWGTKRWSSAINVCKRAKARELFPGSEQPLLYLFNPGEGFAESYRLLNEEKEGLPITPWQVVDPSLQPNAQALAALEQDVVDPWTANTTVTLSGSFTRRGSRVRTFKVETPLDGAFHVSVAASAGEKLRVSAPSLVCGARTTSVRITRVAGSGAFTLSVTRP